MKKISFGYLGNGSDNVLSEICKQVWDNSAAVIAARKELSSAMSSAVASDKIAFALIDAARIECVSRVVNVLIDGTKVDKGDEPQLKGELTAYLNDLSTANGLPYNYTTKSATYLDTENRKESYCAGLYQEYIRIKRLAGAQKREKADKLETMLRQLKSYGFDRETAVTRAAELYNVPEEKALSVYDSINI